LLALHEVGDESYNVEAAIVEALAKVSDSPPRDILEASLSKESHRDVIRSKALAGLSLCKDIEALETLKTWTKQGHNRTARMAAMNALAQSLKTHEFPKEKQTEAVELLAGYLKETGPRIRRSAIAALTLVPTLAQNETDRLANMADHDADPRVRTAAKNAVKKIEEAGSPNQVQKLQTELEKLQEQYKKLQEQVEKIQSQSK
jgi:HEAT repeat protein